MRRAVARWLLAAGIAVPMIPIAVAAVSGRWRYPGLLPQELSARGMRLLADADSGVADALATSLLIGVAVTVLALAAGIPAGRALGLYTFRGRRAVQVLLLAPAVVPSLAVLLGTQVYFLRLGLADTVAGVVLVHLVPALPYVVLVMTGAYATYDTGHEDQARLLGAGRLRRAAHVTLPALRPSIAVAAALCFLVSWSEYALTLLIGGGRVTTLPLLLVGYARGTDLTQAAAVALLLVAPPLLALALLARRLPGAGSLLSAGRP